MPGSSETPGPTCGIGSCGTERLTPATRTGQATVAAMDDFLRDMHLLLQALQERNP